METVIVSILTSVIGLGLGVGSVLIYNNRRSEGAYKKADEIIERANEKSRNIVRQAMENSVELRTENTTIMKNLKSISDMIAVILEKGIQ